MQCDATVLPPQKKNYWTKPFWGWYLTMVVVRMHGGLLSRFSCLATLPPAVRQLSWCPRLSNQLRFRKSCVATISYASCLRRHGSDDLVVCARSKHQTIYSSVQPILIPSGYPERCTRRADRGYRDRAVQAMFGAQAAANVLESVTGP